MSGDAATDTDEEGKYILRINTFLDEVKSSKACPFCGTTTWHSASSKKFQHFFPTEDLNAGVRCFVLACTNCGFMRSHSLFVMERHDESKEAEFTPVNDAT